MSGLDRLGSALAASTIKSAHVARSSRAMGSPPSHISGTCSKTLATARQLRETTFTALFPSFRAWHRAHGADLPSPYIDERNGHIP
ncbi:MAG: hypothetical protein QOF09_3070 [Alphaproteobacteria bacterium]|nr:hypothetical protein [Alphaproteobacteria bacterium]